MKSKFICSRCDNKLKSKNNYCGKCFKETFDLPFGFIEKKGLQLEYNNYIEKMLEKRWVK